MNKSSLISFMAKAAAALGMNPDNLNTNIKAVSGTQKKYHGRSGRNHRLVQAQKQEFFTHPAYDYDGWVNGDNAAGTKVERKAHMGTLTLPHGRRGMMASMSGTRRNRIWRIGA